MMDMTQDMNVIRYMLRKLLFLMVLSFGSIAMWGQSHPYEGIWYMTNNTDYYMVPAKDPTVTTEEHVNEDAYFSADYSVQDGDPEKPFITTYKTNGDINSVWILTPVSGENNYYYIIHAATGKYVKFQTYYSDARRKYVHLETVATPGETEKFEITALYTGVKIKPKNHTYYFNVAGGNQDRYNGGTSTGYYSGMIGGMSGTDGGSQFALVDASSSACASPVITYNSANGEVTMSSVTDGATIYYTTDGSDPTTSSTLYSSAFTVSSTTVIKAIAVKAGLANSSLATKQVVKHTYNIVNRSGSIAIQYTMPYPSSVGEALNGYSSIPAEIRSPYIADETIKFYAMEGEFNAANLDVEHQITATPATTNIYVTYTPDNLGSKFVKLSGASPFNLKNSSSQYLYDNGSSSDGSAVAAETNSTTNAEAYVNDKNQLWYFYGNDPYDIQIRNANNSKYLTTSGSNPVWSDAAVSFVLTGQSDGADDAHKSVTLKNRANSETVTLGVNTVVLKRSYTLIDKAGKVIQAGIDYVDAEGFGLPAAWRSPLAAYHYWNAEAFEVTDGTFTLVSPAPSEITTATQVSSDNVIYVTYDVNTELLDLDGRNLTGSGNGTTYMLQFANGASFKQEDGSDGVMSETRKAVYPYSNGDGTLYIYGQERWEVQLASGASTRTRWLWYLEPALKVGDDYVLDPYHVRVSSYQTQTSYKIDADNTRNFHSYLWTYRPSDTYSGYVTGVTNDNPLVGGGEESDPAITDLPKGSEYMLIGTALSSLKLVTYDPISNGTTTERRTVNSFEQYWKNNPTVQGKLTTKVTAVGRNVELTDAQKSQLPSGWHTYAAWANSAPWVHNHDEATTGGTPTTSKKFMEEEHVFQTISMDDGSFQFVPTEIKPMLILLDQHGWEIVRLQLPNGPDDPNRAERYREIHKYSSPMVARYHFWKTGTKVPGYHKFKVSDYATVSDTDDTEYTADELGRADITDPLTPPNLPNYATQALVSGKERDWYVTYDVEDEYASAYVGADTEDDISPSQYLIKQGDNYAQLSGTSLSSTSTEPDLENVPETMQWYLRPNFDIDEEMGYNYGGAYEEKTKEETEKDYFDSTREDWVSTWSNGFDPYNVQIQSVSNTARYFTANTTGSAVSSAWTGTSSSITTENISVRQPDVAGHDQVKTQITNATFMVVDDGHGNMRLMPRFDNTRVMQSFTTLAAPAEQTASVNENQIFTLKLVPQTVHSSSEINAMGGKYILASNFTASGSIGTRGAPFKGTIEGQIDRSFSVSAPFIAFAEDAVIKNVIIESATVSGDTVGAIVNQAKGNTRIYNCGVKDGTVSGTDIAGSIVGHLDDYSRVINCYSYADVSGGTYAAGIVGYNAFPSTQANLRTMVMNCMFYGDIKSGSKVSPVYGGKSIDNLHGGLNTFNYYAYDVLKTKTIGEYNCALGVQDKFLQRFEFYRQLLNSNHRLAAFYATGDKTNANQMAKWVLETADRSIANPKPYPVLRVKETGRKDPSIINYDVVNAPDSASVGRNHGGKLGRTLTVTISGVGVNAPTAARITTGSLTLQRMDKDFDRYNFNYDKVQLPYYNDVGEGNYTTNSEKKSRVVTGWKITGISGGTAGTYKAADEWGGFNFSDRKCTNKDLYGTSGRVFSQGAYFDVPYGVTGITIEPYWGEAAYVADEYLDVVYNSDYGAQSVTQLGRLFGTNGVEVSINGSTQKVYNSIGIAVGALGTGGTVYDHAVVLVGNVHLNGTLSTADKSFTLMSIDLDKDNEPDCSLMLSHNGRANGQVSPIRFDFLNVPGIAMAQKPKGAGKFFNVSIYKPKGWFEITNTTNIYFVQFEYDNGNKSLAPVIFQGGMFDQFVSTQSSKTDHNTSYIHIGGNAWFKEFGNGTHSDGWLFTPHIPISVTGGDFESFYLSGTYRPDAEVKEDNAECYISGGRFAEVAGASQQMIDGDVRWQIYDADIENFYGGGINYNKPVTGNITVDIFNSHVGTYCGGPKFGDMQKTGSITITWATNKEGSDTKSRTKTISTDRTVTTRATGCEFDYYFGAGYGGISYNRVRTQDATNYNFSSWQNNYTDKKGKYITSNNGVATDFDYEFFVWSTGQTGGRFYVKYSSLSMAKTNDVSSTLTRCIVNRHFYGGGSLGRVDGTATSVLDGCTVEGNVFGGGYSADKPKVPLRTGGFTAIPKIDTNAGVFDMGEMSATEDYTLVQGTLSNNTLAINTTEKTIITDVDFATLGQVTHADVTVKGNTIVRGKIFNADGSVRDESGGVFGGGDESAVNGDVSVSVESTEASEGILNVFGGGNTADVLGSATVTMSGGKVSQDIYGGGKGATTVVAGDVTVGISAGTVSRDVYGGSALGTVNATTVTLSGGTVSGSVFGGGLGQVAADAVAAVGEPGDPGYVPAQPAKEAIVAHNQGNTKVTMEGGTVKTAVYGGSNVNGVLAKNDTVTITGGTIGNSWTTPVPSPLPNVVFGGGKGEPTLVNGHVTVNLGTLTTGPTYTGTATVWGNVYGGSALGNTNASKSGSDPMVFYTSGDDKKTTTVNLYGGTVNGNVFGGGLGQKNGENGATSDIVSYVGGDVLVTLDGVKLSKASGTGQIFGCNNLNGTPKGHVKVHVKRTINIVDANNKKDLSTATLEQRTANAALFDVNAVYGGGNKADYNPTKATGTDVEKEEAFAEVLIEGCDTTSIQYVYGGGNAAAVPATQVTINSAYIIDQLFGGGNGAGEGNPGADVGIIDKSAYAADESTPKTAGTYGTGVATTKLVGGQVHYVYGGSNTLGNVRGGTSLERNESNSCELKIGEIYGAGQIAPMDGDVNIILECMPESFVEAVYGGAKNAVVNGNVSLTVTSGKYGRVFGGNNEGGSINGSITVNVYEDGCQPLIIGEVYGGGYQAPYSIYGCTKDGETWTANKSGTLYFDQAENERAAVEVNVFSCTSIGKVFGGGYQAPVIGNTDVRINMMKGLVDGDEQDNIGKIGQVFGGGNDAKVVGNTTLYIGTATSSNKYSKEETLELGVKITSGTDYLSATSDTPVEITAGVYGGGNAADVEGNTTLNIGTADQSLGIRIDGDIYGGGYGETTTVTGDVVVNIGEDNAGTPVGYAAITGDVYGGSAKGKVNATKGTDPAFSATAEKTTTVNFYGGTLTGNIYGGGLGDSENSYAADVYGPVTVNVEGGTVTNVFGCNNVLGSPKSTATVNIHGTATPVEPATYSVGTVYGGGNQAAYTGTGGVSVAMSGGAVNDVFGGGLGASATVNGTTTVALTGGTVTNDVYGGGSLGSVTGAVSVTLNGATVSHDVYGGGLGRLAELYTAEDAEVIAGTKNVGDVKTSAVAANVNGPVSVAVLSGSAANVFGCNNINGAPQSTVAVVIGAKDGEGNLSGTATVSRNVYGGGNVAECTSSPTVTLYGGTINNNIYGGGLGSTAKTGGSTVLMEGGTVKNDVYGGGSEADVTGSVSVSISGGTIVNDVYGGGALANTNTANWNSSTNTWAVESATPVKYYVPVKHLKAGESVVYGYYLDAEGTSQVTVKGTKAAENTTYYKELEYNPNIYAIAKSDGHTTYTTTVSLTGGKIGNAYGGGLGKLTAGGLPTGEGAVKAMVYGDVSVTVDEAAFTADVEPSAKNAPVTGRVFGCNNINGTPKGKVTVLINKTKRIDGGEHTLGEFEIQGVYGGGNLSDYEPETYDSDTEFGQFTKVIINDCAASISKVYGGGNAASVPFTDVTINGAFEIGYVFGGGNGGDMIYKNGSWIDNTGADVVYYTNVLLKGGTIGQAFGGSDSRGTVGSSNIRQETGGLCPLRLVNLYGAGNGEEASSAGDITVDVSGCGENNEIQNVYGGSYKANITGSVTLNIKSGIFTNVFGGNDRMGSIGGNITVNIEESDDCDKPIIIQNLYGGCYQTAYPGESNVDTHAPAHDKNGDPFTTGKITVNVRSATRIDRIYGGSERGEVTGDTEVNINMVKGSMRGHDNVTLPSYYTVSNHPDNVTVNPEMGWATVYNYYPTDEEIAMGREIPTVDGYYERTGDSEPYTYTPVTGFAEKGKTYYKQVVQGTIADSIGTIGDVYGGGNIGKVTGNTTVNIGTASKLTYTAEPTHLGTLGTDYIKNGDIYEAPVLGAHITGDVFGGCYNADITGNTTVNICTADYSTPPANFEDVSIEKGSVYGGGNQADVLGNTSVTMAGGYVFDGVYGGGLHGSVGTFTRTTTITTESNGVNHESHTGCVGKPTSCEASTGKCTVVVSGGQVGPVEVALATGGMKNTGRHFKKAGERNSPVDYGFVFGAGRGEVEDPATDADADFHCYVNETDVTISGTALIMASVYGGGENGRVLHDTKVTIAGGQVGCGQGEYNVDGSGNPTTGRAYTATQWETAAAAVASGNAASIDAAALAECPSWVYGKDTGTDGIKDQFLPYDPLYFEPILGEGDSDDDAGEGTDGHTYYGNVFGGGSGYYPFERRDGGVQKHDWLRSAGLVEGNTVVNITGGHILTSVYGGNEVTDVKGKCTITMWGGTIGVPRTLAQIADHPVTCYLFGAGKGDQRTHFNTWTNVQETVVNVTGGIIYGSVFGGGEDGHVLGDAQVNIEDGAKIGTWGTSYVDGNVFGGGRGFSGEALTAGTVGGNVDVNITGGTMLGSVYGGGRLASVGLFFTNPTNDNYGQLQDGDAYGHVTIDISGGTIGGGREGSAADKSAGYCDITHSGNVFGGPMGRLKLLDNTTFNPLWPELAQAKTTAITISGTADIKRNVYGGGEFGTVRENAAVTVSGGTVSGNVFGGGYGSADYEHATPITVKWNGATMHYVYTPMQWAGMVGGNTTVSVSDGHVYTNVYGGGELASVGIIDFSATENSSGDITAIDGKKYSYDNIIKHADILNPGTVNEQVRGFGLSWPYKFTYVPNKPSSDAVGGKATVTITGGRIGETGIDHVQGYVFGGGKGKAMERYAEAFCANVRETDVTINYASTPSSDEGTTACIGAGVYGGAEDGHVYKDTKVQIKGGLIGFSVYGGGKGIGTYSGKLRDRDTKEYKALAELLPSWTAGKVYGNTSVEMTGGHVMRNVVGGGYYGSVGKGNYASGTDDYYPAGYGETLTGNLWDGESELSQAFLNSGKTSVTITGGTVGTATGTYDGYPTGQVYGGSRGIAAEDVTLSPRYDYAPNFFLGYANETEVIIGDADHSPTIYGSVYGGGRDGHVRRSTSVTINNGTIGVDYESLGADRRDRGNVYGSGSGMGTWDGTHHGSSSGSVTRNTTVTVKGGTIYNNVYGGGALSSVGPPQIGSIEIAGKDITLCQVNIEGGTIGTASGYAAGYGGCVYGASRGGDLVTGESLDSYATAIWTEVNIKPNATDRANDPVIYGNVYGGGKAGRVKKDTEVNLTGGEIKHNAYGGGQGTRTSGDTMEGVEAHIGGNTTVMLNKDVDEEAKGCIVQRIFGCNDLNGTPKGHVLVHVYATQHKNQLTIGSKYKKFDKLANYTVDNYSTHAFDGKTLADLASDAGADVSAYTTTLSSGSAAEKAAALANMIEAIADKKYDVFTVYGGGDLAIYDPSSPEEKTEVIIDGCELTSIKQVYGGSNAASTPATYVRVNAAYEIHDLFGGGNGYDGYELNGKWYENPGANVGYYATFHHDTTDPEKGTQSNPYPRVENDGTDGYADARQPDDRRANYAYGQGITQLEVTGGRIHRSYGGSNKNGNIRSEARSAYQDAGSCEMSIDETTGGSKDSPIDARIIADMECVDYAGQIFGGSTNADVYSDIVLNITNGTFGEVYGGNNTSGKIYGSITVNVRENGCKPIIIGSLYGGGYLADYSIYGYKDGGAVRTKAEYEALSDSEKARIGIKRDPQINVISATRINSIFGGGNQAKVVGSPHVNVNMEKGRIVEKFFKQHPEYATADQTDTRLGGGPTVVWRCEEGGALPIGTVGNIYGSGNLADVWGDTFVEVGTGKHHNEAGVEEVIAPARNAATITGNVFGGGKGKADTFECEKAMVGVADSDEGSTSVVIANGSVGGSVYGGGEIGRVEKDTEVTIGVDGEVADDSKFKPEIAGHVFGAGQGVDTHSYSGLTRGNSTVTIQGLAKVNGSVYGGGEKATVGWYNVVNGKPTTPISGGVCTVTVKDNAEIGPDDMVMINTTTGKPDDAGHVFGAGQGVVPGDYTYADNDHKPQKASGATLVYIDSESDYISHIETLGLASETNLTISGNAFIKGSVYGGSENGYVQTNTNVTIAGGQIGNGYVQMAADGTYLATKKGVNRRYTDAEWTAGYLIDALKDGTTAEATGYTSSLPECASWTYESPWQHYDKFADSYDSKGGAVTGTNGSTFYGNVFGGGSGYYPYAAGKWHKSAGSVGGNTTVTITGGHILTNVYGGNEMTNVKGDATINFGGNATLGVPRTVKQILKHPVTCYLYGAGKGDPRVMFNKDTNVDDVTVNITGGTIYGSAFGGGEDGHVLGNVTMNISNNTEEANHVDTKIGTWGTSYVDGNVFGAGRGFGGEAYTAGNVGGSVTMNISGGTMLGSVYGGGRMGTVGYDLLNENETGYGEMRNDEEGFPRGHVTINITGGTIGNANEFIVPDEGFENWTADQWTTWKQNHNVPNTEYDTATGMLTHTKGGNVYAGGMGRYLKLDGATPITGVDWKKLGNVKSTTLNISGNDTWIMGNVYGGGEMGAVTPYRATLESDASTTATVTISGGTIGTEVTGSTPVKETVDVPESGSSNVKYTYGSVYGGGMGMAEYDATENHGGDLHGSSTVSISGENTKVRASVFGGGEMAIVGGDATVNVNGGEIGRNEVRATDGMVMFGGGTMGNVYGGGKGEKGHTNAGLVKGNTTVSISGGSIYHNVYGGGALASVGTFDVSDGSTPSFIPVAGIPYNWTSGGTATINITGGTIGISGRENGMVFGSSRGDIAKPEGDPAVDPYDKLAWVNQSVVKIGTEGKTVDDADYLTAPLIKGSVYGGGENGHNSTSAEVHVYSGTIGITNEADPWYAFADGDVQTEARLVRGNVYGAGCGTDTYTGDDGEEHYNEMSGMVGGNTSVSIEGGHVARSVYGAGAMASVGTVKSSTKHDSDETGFALSWPYLLEFADGTGKATIEVTGGHIGTRDIDGGDVYGGARGIAGDRYETANLAYVKETEVEIDYPTTVDISSSDIENDFSTQCVTGSVHGSGENGYVYGDTRVTLNKGLIGHSLYGAGKGSGTYTKRLLKIDVDPDKDPKVDADYYDAKIYSLIAGKVMGNTYVTMNDGHVVRNVYGGGNLGSVGKGNYAGGTDDYFPTGYGETLAGNLWTSSTVGVGLPDTSRDNAWHFLNSGKATVQILGGTVGYIDPANPAQMKNNLIYGNVFGGSAGVAVPNVPLDLSPRYEYCPAFYSGYVNETDVTIGTLGQSNDDAGQSGKAPLILGSVYGGGQDGHVRRWTHVTVNSGVIGMAFNEANKTLLQSSEINGTQWLYRGCVYGGGSGVSEFTYDFNGDGDFDDTYTVGDKEYTERGHSTASGSVTHFTQVDVLGGLIYRAVLGGGSLGSVGPPKITQPDYAACKTSDATQWGQQSLNQVNIGGGKVGDTVVKATIGEPTGVAAGYGGNVFGGGRGEAGLGSDFGTSIWTQVNVKNGANILGNVFGGGNAGEVMKDTEVKIGEKAAP